MVKKGSENREITHLVAIIVRTHSDVVAIL